MRGPVQFTFARSINPIFSKSNSLTRCCITKESDESKNNTFGNKYTVSYGLYRMHGLSQLQMLQRQASQRKTKNSCSRHLLMLLRMIILQQEER